MTGRVEALAGWRLCDSSQGDGSQSDNSQSDGSRVGTIYPEDTYSHARRKLMPPPMEKPSAYTRSLAMVPACCSTSAMRSRRKPTSSSVHNAAAPT